MNLAGRSPVQPWLTGLASPAGVAAPGGARHEDGRGAAGSGCAQGPSPGAKFADGR